VNSSTRLNADEKSIAGTWRRTRISFFPPPPRERLCVPTFLLEAQRKQTWPQPAGANPRAGNLSAAERAERQAKLAAQLLDLKASLKKIALARIEAERPVRAESRETAFKEREQELDFAELALAACAERASRATSVETRRGLCGEQ
jgi:hypothetical protein